MDSTQADVVSFTSMVDGTAADYHLLDGCEKVCAAGLSARILETLDCLTDSLGGYQISRLEHSLQTATRARLDGASVNWIVAALVHDIGDSLAPYNHAEVAAAILQPYVPAEVHWVVQQHGLFQSYYYAHHFGGDRNGRDRFADHQWSALCAEFCERWDQTSFDPDFPIHDLASFEDDVRAVFGRDQWDDGVVAPGNGTLI
jgi:predicted HD phosphohydrolase